MCVTAKIHLPAQRVREVEQECQGRDQFFFGGYDESEWRRAMRKKRKTTKVKRSGSVQGAK